MERLLIDDRNIFDFYKGLLKEKGTKRSFGKLNRSTYIMDAENNEIELFENWAFKIGEFGYTSNSSVIELKIQPDLITQDPQIISFTTADNVKANSSIVDITWNNQDWLKQKENKSENKFNFTNDFKFYPTAGFAQIGETNYIVDNEATFKTTFENMKVGEKVWVSFAETNQGWDIFKNVVAAVKDAGCNYDFYYFGNGSEKVDGVTPVEVDIATQGKDAMINNLKEKRISAVFLVCVCGETYSYTTYESNAANCFIFAMKSGGNIPYTVEKNGWGHVFSTEEELIAAVLSEHNLRNEINNWKIYAKPGAEEYRDNDDILKLFSKTNKAKISWMLSRNTLFERVKCGALNKMFVGTRLK